MTMMSERQARTCRTQFENSRTLGTGWGSGSLRALWECDVRQRVRFTITRVIWGLRFGRSETENVWIDAFIEVD